MSKKKFFSLIRGGELHVAPETKIIKAKTFSSMLTAKALLKTVKEDAEAYRIEVATECEKLKEQAQKEGYEAGFLEWAKEIVNLQEEIKSIRSEFSKMMAPIALKATQKIVGKALEMSDTLIFEIVSNALKPVTHHKKIAIYVNRKDIKVLEEKRETLRAQLEEVEFLTIREREDITPGGCVIETEGGIINARLENQWLLLEKAFGDLMKQADKEKPAIQS